MKLVIVVFVFCKVIPCDSCLIISYPLLMTLLPFCCQTVLEKMFLKSWLDPPKEWKMRLSWLKLSGGEKEGKVYPADVVLVKLINMKKGKWRKFNWSGHRGEDKWENEQWSYFLDKEWEGKENDPDEWTWMLRRNVKRAPTAHKHPPAIQSFRDKYRVFFLTGAPLKS